MSECWTDRLVAMNACPDAVEWARDYPSLAAAWKACKRADWMLWLAGELCQTLPQRKKLTLAALGCARTALKYVPKGEKRPLVAIRTAERWARGTHGVTQDDVVAAGAAAWDAAGAAAWDAAGDAAGAAARAAARATGAAARATGDASWAAWDASWAARAAARDARAAARAAWAAGTAWAAWDAAKVNALARMSTIVRKHYPTPPHPRR